MRLSRMLFGWPLASMLVAAALMFASPSYSIDYGPGYTHASYEVPDFALTYIVVEHDAVLAVAAPIDKPADAHLAVYVRANQPLASWRLAADTAYRHIDPHIYAV